MDREIIIRADRVRKIPESFAWIDHRLWREGYVRIMGGNEVRVYLFLLLVGNRYGVSYWRDRSICRHLGIAEAELTSARRNLVSMSLISYSQPYYQVLSLPEAEEPARGGEPAQIGALIENSMKNMRRQV